MTRVVYLAPRLHGSAWQMPATYHTRADCYRTPGQWRIPTAEDVVQGKLQQCRACRLAEAKSA